MRTTIISGLIIIALAVFYCGYTCTKPTPQAKSTPLSSNTVDYSGYTAPDAYTALKRYGTDAPVMNYTITGHTSRDISVRVEGVLVDRTWSQDVAIPVARNGNWKYYIGAGVIVGVVATAGLVYLFK